MPKIKKIKNGEYIEGTSYSLEQRANGKVKLTFNPDEVITPGTPIGAEEINEIQKNNVYSCSLTRTMAGQKEVYTANLQGFENFGKFEIILQVNFTETNTTSNPILRIENTEYHIQNISVGKLRGEVFIKIRANKAYILNLISEELENNSNISFSLKGALNLKNWLVSNYTTLMNNIKEVLDTKIETIKTSINGKLNHGGYGGTGQDLKNDINTKIDKTSIINNLTTGGTTNVLSAEQGKKIGERTIIIPQTGTKSSWVKFASLKKNPGARSCGFSCIITGGGNYGYNTIPTYSLSISNRQNDGNNIPDSVYFYSLGKDFFDKKNEIKIVAIDEGTRISYWFYLPAYCYTMTLTAITNTDANVEYNPAITTIDPKIGKTYKEFVSKKTWNESNFDPNNKVDKNTSNTINGGLTVNSLTTPVVNSATIELIANNPYPFIDFKREDSQDYLARIYLNNDNNLALQYSDGTIGSIMHSSMEIPHYKGGANGSTNLNTLVNSGVYQCQNMTDAQFNPVTGVYGWGQLVVFRAGVSVTQIYYAHQKNQTLVRRSWDGGAEFGKWASTSGKADILWSGGHYMDRGANLTIPNVTFENYRAIVLFVSVENHENYFGSNYSGQLVLPTAIFGNQSYNWIDLTGDDWCGASLINNTTIKPIAGSGVWIKRVYGI